MYSLYGWFGSLLACQERFALIKESGFTGILLWWSAEFGDADFALQPSVARKAGLWVENIHAPYAGNSALWEDTLAGEERFSVLLRCLEDCRQQEIPAMVLHLFSNQEPPASPIGLYRLQKLTEAAERLQVNLALENLFSNQLLHFTLDKIHSPRLGFCFDSGHWHCRTPQEDLLAAYGHRLMALHLHDNHGRQTNQLQDDEHRLPFLGTINWEKLMLSLKKTGYGGNLSLEVLCRPGESEQAPLFLAEARRAAERLSQY